MNSEHVKLVIREPFYPDNLTRVAADKTGATVLTLPESPGGVPGTDDYFSFMDYIVKQVSDTLEKAKLSGTLQSGQASDQRQTTLLPEQGA